MGRRKGAQSSLAGGRAGQWRVAGVAFLVTREVYEMEVGFLALLPAPRVTSGGLLGPVNAYIRARQLQRFLSLAP